MGAPTVTVAPVFYAENGNFRLNTSTDAYRRTASASPLEGGGYVGAWVVNPNNLGSRVFVQVFDANGTALGAEFSVAPGLNERQGSPSVVTLAGGGFVVGYSVFESGVDHRVLAQTYDSSGAPVGSAATIATLGAGASAPTNLDLSALPGGGFLATWNTYQGGSTGEVMARLYDVVGAPLGAAFQVNTYTTENQSKPDTAVFSDGSFVVVWQSPGQDGDSSGVYGQRFSGAGSPVGTEFRVNTLTAGNQVSPHVTALAGGGFVVVWEKPEFLAQTFVKAQVYNAAGIAVGGEITVENIFTPGVDAVPIVVGLPDGDFMIAWSRFSVNVRAQRFGPDGTPHGAVFDVSTSVPGTMYYRTTESMIVTGAGELVVLWSEAQGQSSNTTQVYAQRYQLDNRATEQVSLPIANAITVGDDGLGSNVVTVTLSVDFGLLTVATGGSGVGASGNGTGTVALTGTVTQLNALLTGGTGSPVSYLANSDAPPAGATLTVEVRDAEMLFASTTAAIAILGVDDPAIAQPDAATTTEAATKSGNLFVDNGSGADFDDGSALAVAAVNGNAAAVGTTITLASGALLTVQANGDYLYNPNGQFDALPAPGSGASNLTAQDSFTYTLANGGTATVTLTITGVDSADTLYGTAANDTLNGGAGNDTINPGLGKDTVNGEDGDDTIVLNDPYHFVFNGAGFDFDTYNGGNGFDTIEFHPLTSGLTFEYQFGPAYGYSLLQTSSIERLVLASTEAVDLFVATGLPALASVTEVVGGSGRDLLIINASGIGSVFSIPSLTLTNWTSSATPDLEGGDMVMLQASNGNFTLNAFEGLASTQGLLGGSGNETLVGSSGVDMLNGGAGTNTLLGNGGNDILAIVNAKDSQGNITAYTGAGSVFDGGAGIDALSIGGSVNFLGTLTSIEAIHLQPAWTSTLANGSMSQTAAHLTIGAAAAALLPANLALEGIGTITVNLAPGDSYDASGFAIAGGSAITHVVNGSSAGDTIRGLQIAETLYGNDGNDTLDGGSGNDVLDGGTGDDTMAGGAGDDSYLVDNAGDVIVEGFGGGLDTVFTSVSYTLSDDIERLGVNGFTTTYAISLTGNTHANEMWGNDGANVIDGQSGADIMSGYGGNDIYVVDNAGDTIVEGFGGGLDTVFTSISYTLSDDIERLGVNGFTTTYAINLAGNAWANEMWGNDGANILDGRTGADIMSGYGGNDIYVVDNAGDTIVEGFGGGLDTVFTSISYTLSDDIERLGVNGFTTTYAINLAGNAWANEMWGNDGANILDGRTGADIMSGYGGNDIYVVDNAGDTIVEGSGGGFDTVFTSIGYTLSDDIERLGVNGAGTTFAIDLTGNARANEISGNAGANVIAGQGGSDVLIGNGGADTFAFTSSIYAGSIDQVLDFQVGVDKIGLDDGEFAGLSLGALAPGAFRVGAAAQDADDRIIYDQATGALSFDADGSGAGAAVQFAALSSGLGLTASDFLVI